MPLKCSRWICTPWRTALGFEIMDAAGSVKNALDCRGSFLFVGSTESSPTGYTPSTPIIFVFAVRWRILRGSRYSSQFNHSFARCMDSNSSTTMRFGSQSPSSTSVAPPRTMYLPPYFSTVAPASFLYSSYPAGSRISISTITHADILGSEK